MGGIATGDGVLVGLGTHKRANTKLIRHRRTLLRRARFLSPADQSLLKLAREQEYSLRELGRIFDLSPGSVSRRVRQLVARLEDPVAVALIEFPFELPETYRRVGILRLLKGHRTGFIAAEIGQRPVDVRYILAYIDGWARMARTLWTTALANRMHQCQREVADE